MHTLCSQVRGQTSFFHFSFGWWKRVWSGLQSPTRHHHKENGKISLATQDYTLTRSLLVLLWFYNIRTVYKNKQE